MTITKKVKNCINQFYLIKRIYLLEKQNKFLIIQCNQIRDRLFSQDKRIF